MGIDTQRLKNNRTIPSYRRYGVYALVCHILVLGLFISGLFIWHKPVQLTSPVIEASVQTAIPKDKAMVAAEIRAHKKAIAEERAKERAEKLKQLALAKALIKQKAIHLAQQQAQLRQQMLAKQAATLARQMAQKQMMAEARHLAQAQASATAQRRAAQINAYERQLLHVISQVWVIPRGIGHQRYCIVAVQVAPDGTVLKASIVQSSGLTILDQSALQAIYRASPLPVPKNPALFSQFRDLRLTLRPEKIVHVK